VYIAPKQQNEMIQIREENKEDFADISNINFQAFKQLEEGSIIIKIRESGAKVLSLVAERENEIVGHILFSPATLDDHKDIQGGMGLAPMAVLPDYQKQGIGKLLVTEGIRILKAQGAPFIIVLGHPEYYPKFGFKMASKHKLQCQWAEIPDEAFMVLILDEDKMKHINGIVRYREEWNEAV